MHMVPTLELPLRSSLTDPRSAYQSRFGALPFWLDEVDSREVPLLLRQALRRGVPLTPADACY